MRPSPIGTRMRKIPVIEIGQNEPKTYQQEAASLQLWSWRDSLGLRRLPHNDGTTRMIIFKDSSLLCSHPYGLLLSFPFSRYEGVQDARTETDFRAHESKSARPEIGKVSRMIEGSSRYSNSWLSFPETSFEPCSSRSSVQD